MTAQKRTRALPKVRKAFGTSANVDGEVLVYSDGEMATFGDACFADGYRTAINSVAAALAPLKLPRPGQEQSNRIQAEEDAWGDFNAGRGPHPTGFQAVAEQVNKAWRTPGMNTGHGHVWPRSDGIKARCGGPGICAECSRAAARARKGE